MTVIGCYFLGVFGTGLPRVFKNHASK